MNKKFLLTISLVFLLCFFFAGKNFFPVFAQSSEKEIEEIEQQIEAKEKEIKELEEEEKLYQEKIEQIRQEATTLKNQIAILDNQIAKTRLEIEKQEKEIEYLDLSIKNIQFRILEKERQIEKQKEQMKKILQAIYKEDQNSYLTTLLLNPNLSVFVDKIYYLRTLEENLVDSWQKLETIKLALEEQKLAKRQQINELESSKVELENQKAKLDINKQAKSVLLDQSRGAEWKFQSLLAQAVEEQRAREREIEELERIARQKLAELEKEEKLEKLEKEGTVVFSWPVPSQIITCPFHDPDYPYRHIIGEHSGIDLRASQGTPVRAAASGYVAQAKHGGMGYSYVMIVHNETFSTLYGHLSEISVVQGEYVRRGEVIGKSGGLPGTPGAGSFSTGPHLHFEVRMNGIPVDPLNYLL